MNRLSWSNLTIRKLIAVVFSSLILFFVTIGKNSNLFADSERQEGSQYSPASFRDDHFSLQRNIEFPDVEGDVFLLVRCTTGVKRNGRLVGYSCGGENADSEKFEKQVFRAMPRSRFHPASIDGTRRPVTMKFSVVFERVGNNESIAVFPNDMMHADKHGLHYMAPQLIFDTSPTKVYCRRVALQVTVSSTGTVESVRRLGGSSTDICIEKMSRQILKRNYVPGFVDGVPTTMEHLAVGTLDRYISRSLK